MFGICPRLFTLSLKKKINKKRHGYTKLKFYFIRCHISSIRCKILQECYSYLLCISGRFRTRKDMGEDINKGSNVRFLILVLGKYA